MRKMTSNHTIKKIAEKQWIERKTLKAAGGGEWGVRYRRINIKIASFMTGNQNSIHTMVKYLQIIGRRMRSVKREKS